MRISISIKTSSWKGENFLFKGKQETILKSRFVYRNFQHIFLLSSNALWMAESFFYICKIDKNLLLSAVEYNVDT